MSATTLVPPTDSSTCVSPRTGLVFGGDEFYLPVWVNDLTTFRRWCLSDDYPERGHVDFLDGIIWVDMSMEKFFSHNQIKEELGFVIGGIIRAAQLGRYIPDNMRLINEAAALSCEPDGAFATYETFRTGRLKVNEAANELELLGTPDMVLEVISKSSVNKDTKRLPPLYLRAGVTEYWLVDARTDDVRFDLQVRTDSGYEVMKDADGWSKSLVFGREFRLVKSIDPLGQPAFRLDVR